MEETTKFLDRLIEYLNSNKANTGYVPMNESDLLRLCELSKNVLIKDQTLLRIEAPLIVCGDVHGQFVDLMKFLDRGGPVETTKYLFLGDYVDRGINSVATLSMLLCIKCRYPDHIWLLRGNHETRETSEVYGFLAECETRYSMSVYDAFNVVFDYLPLVAIISDRIFCVHGGLSKHLKDIREIEILKRPIKDELLQDGLIVDLLWADPSFDSNGYCQSDRGTSFTFGEDVADEFLHKNDFDLICRAHQVVSDGFEFPFYPKQTVLTVFSAPNYCNDYGNKGAVLKVAEDLTCSFIFLDPPKTGNQNLRPASSIGKGYD